MVLAVGGKSALYYLPLTIAERKGFFKDAGLDVEINDFQGGSKSLEALMGGSADVTSGAYEHTLRMQQRGQPIKGFVLMGRGMQIAIGLRKEVAAKVKGPADIKGMKFGVSAPGSSTHMLLLSWAAKGGLKATRRGGDRRRRRRDRRGGDREGPGRRRVPDRSRAHHPAGQGPDRHRGRYPHGEGQPGDFRRRLPGGLPLRPAGLPHQEPQHGAGARHRDRARRRVAADGRAGRRRQDRARGLPAGRPGDLREVVRGRARDASRPTARCRPAPRRTA